MNSTTLRRVIAAAAVALVALPAAAFAADAVHETSAFKVTAPADWTVKQLEGKEDGLTGHWLVKSPSGNRKLYIFVSDAKAKQTVHDAFNHYLGAKLRTYFRHARVQTFDVTKVNGGTLGMGFIYGASKDNSHARNFKAAVMVAHQDGGKRVVHAALAGSEDSWGKTALRMQTILSSIGLK